MWKQVLIEVGPFSRGIHLITDIIQEKVSHIKKYDIGLMTLFIQHTSASLSINENADLSVRVDMESHFNQMVPENASYYTHIYEGSDDMPAHIKSSLLGSSVTIPMTNGQLNMGIWQGIYLCEHRNQGGKRRLLVTLQGNYK